jgi:hypothetical protein
MAASKTALQNKKKSNQNLNPAPEPASQEQPLSDSKKKATRKSGRKSKSGKLAACTRPPAPGVAGSKLRNAINFAVAAQPRAIADALIDGTIKGNVSSAKLLIDLTGARNATESKKKPKGISLAQFLAEDDDWQDPADANTDVLFGGREPEL